METLSIVEAAQELGISKPALYKAIKAGRLPVERERPTLVSREAVEAYRATLGQRNGWATQKEGIVGRKKAAGGLREEHGV